MSEAGVQAVFPIGLKKVSNFGGMCVACRRNPFPHPVAQTKWDHTGSNERRGLHFSIGETSNMNKATFTERFFAGSSASLVDAAEVRLESLQIS